MFELDHRLADDTIYIGEFRLCKILLMNDKQYPWIILVPMVSDVTELFQLNTEQKELLTAESNFVAETMYELFKADKMNVAALGNLVPQLHIHHIARFKNDITWPNPVWGLTKAKPYSKEELEKTLPRLIEKFDNFIN